MVTKGVKLSRLEKQNPPLQLGDSLGSPMTISLVAALLMHVWPVKPHLQPRSFHLTGRPKLGRRATAPRHGQRLVSHTTVERTTDDLLSFSSVAPSTRRRAIHHPLRVLPLPSSLTLSYGPGFDPSQNIQNTLKS
jgi:hypothetical protein